MYHKVSGFYHDTQKRKITSFKQISYRYQNLNMKLQFSKEYEEKNPIVYLKETDFLSVTAVRTADEWERD